MSRLPLQYAIYHKYSNTIIFQQFLHDIKGVKDQILDENKTNDVKKEKQGPSNVLDRFKAKKRTK